MFSATVKTKNTNGKHFTFYAQMWHSNVFLRISLFFGKMLESLSSPILLHLVQISW